MHQHPLDLFGEVPVSLEDVAHWLQCVPQMDPTSKRAAWYARAYNVPDKIRAAKLAGIWDSIKPPEAPASTLARFGWLRPAMVR